jgi:hypothetical protein
MEPKYRRRERKNDNSKFHRTNIVMDSEKVKSGNDGDSWGVKVYGFVAECDSEEEAKMVQKMIERRNRTAIERDFESGKWKVLNRWGIPKKHPKDGNK